MQNCSLLLRFEASSRNLHKNIKMFIIFNLKWGYSCRQKNTKFKLQNYKYVQSREIDRFKILINKQSFV